MRVARSSLTLPATVHEAETCWYDTALWPSWVEGLERVVAVEAPWPRAGGRVIWQSGPAGRGRVVETALEYVQLEGQMAEVQDDSIKGRQHVAFNPVDGGVEVVLTLEYELKRKSLLMPVVDVLFIRRAMTTSLATTLSRFGAELSTRTARAPY